MDCEPYRNHPQALCYTSSLNANNTLAELSEHAWRLAGQEDAVGQIMNIDPSVHCEILIQDVEICNEEPEQALFLRKSKKFQQ